MVTFLLLGTFCLGHQDTSWLWCPIVRYASHVDKEKSAPG